MLMKNEHVWSDGFRILRLWSAALCIMGLWLMTINSQAHSNVGHTQRTTGTQMSCTHNAHNLLVVIGQNTIVFCVAQWVRTLWF